MMQWGKFRQIAWFAALIAMASMTAFSQEAASRPSNLTPTTRPASFYRAPVLMMTLQQIRSGVQHMNLPQDENSKAIAILDQAQAKADQLADDMQGLPPGQRAMRVNPFLQNLRQQLAAVLTPDQMQTLQSQAAPGAGGGPLQALQNELASLNLTPDQQQRVSAVMSDAGQQLQKQTDSIRQQVRIQLAGILTAQQLAQLRDANQQRDVSTFQPPPTARPSSHSEPATKPDHPDIGAAAPDFRVTALDGHTLSLADFKGHTLVIEFGSLSCPTFRDHAKQMEQLHQQETGKASFLIIYTREAHPVGGWEIQSNKDAGIWIKDPTDLAGRITLARRAQISLAITIPMAVDSMTESTCDTYGLFPNGAVVIGKDGKIIACQEWANADGLQAAIEQVGGE
jgi:hypothetical protein